MTASLKSKVLDDVGQIDMQTCQSAAICRVLGTSKVAPVRFELVQLANARGSAPGDPFVMGDYLKPRVQAYKYNGNASLKDLIKAIADGYQVITHGWFTQSGHVIGISGWNPKTETFVAEDPWFEFEFPTWSYLDQIGNDAPYSARGIYAACVAGASAEDAARIYNTGDVNYDEPGMWLHMIKN